MTELGSVAWPSAPLRTPRLVLRESEARDRTAYVELLTSSQVRAYLGGPRPREDVERTLPDVPGRRPGTFVVDHGGQMIGLVTFDRRDPARPGRVRLRDGDAELSYAFLPTAWGQGYAAEACTAALRWFAGALPAEPVVLCTQAANDRSVRLAVKLGFTEVERFEEFDAEQWFGVWSPTEPAR
ncbi:GNAT family N-acetyltransferase [Kitasatospora sp. NPDC001539]|uniref:GNAT family N-acetyltransferase n=1 Tax=Kitasatospora sp. NPDC001539 TaxID=3154384 RepID=UPI0033286CDC